MGYFEKTLAAVDAGDTVAALRRLAHKRNQSEKLRAEGLFEAFPARILKAQPADLAVGDLASLAQKYCLAVDGLSTSHFICDATAIAVADQGRPLAYLDYCNSASDGGPRHYDPPVFRMYRAALGNGHLDMLKQLTQVFKLTPSPVLEIVTPAAEAFEARQRNAPTRTAAFRNRMHAGALGLAALNGHAVAIEWAFAQLHPLMGGERAAPTAPPAAPSAAPTAPPAGPSAAPAAAPAAVPRPVPSAASRSVSSKSPHGRIRALYARVVYQGLRGAQPMQVALACERAAATAGYDIGRLIQEAERDKPHRFLEFALTRPLKSGDGTDSLSLSAVAPWLARVTGGFDRAAALALTRTDGPRKDRTLLTRAVTAGRADSVQFLADPEHMSGAPLTAADVLAAHGEAVYQAVACGQIEILVTFCEPTATEPCRPYEYDVAPADIRKCIKRGYTPADRATREWLEDIDAFIRRSNGRL